MTDPVSGRPAATATPPIPGGTTGTPELAVVAPAVEPGGWRERLRAFRARHAREESLAFFIGGFLFDAVMVGRIDETPLLIQQAAYLAVTGLLLGGMLRFEIKELEPPRWLRLPWRYVEHAMHFMLGTLLNAFSLFYVKSGSGTTAILFLGLISLLLLINEHPRFHRLGPVVLFGLYSFSLTSYLAYLLPVLLGHLRGWMFFAASALSLLPILFLARLMARCGEDSRRAFRQAVGPAIGVQVLLLLLFVAHLVPPVPLSVRSLGVWHAVEREGQEFKLSRLPGGRWSSPWRKDEPVFLARPGDRVFVFTRIFAPHNFRDQVRVRWARWEPARRDWTQSDAIPLRIVGGREEGFGGYAYKQNWAPGEWRVAVETEDGREIGRTRFEIRPDAETSERVFEVLRN
ncbi:MAG TPA: DUF2914 domain-containing protein [Myxococcaceae bacterium]|nr:DUF2914 domain-containing protein [Myxococcaceae bacterium]